MEVHKHTHTPRQKWSHYFWEFFMLFLAIISGFLVENQREHYIEHKRAKQFAEALLSDLASDTTSLSSNIFNLREVLASQSAMISLMSAYHKTRIPGAMLYYHAYYSGSGAFFSAKTATLDQLKNSGSLRYFKNFELIRLINEYDQALTNQFMRSSIDQTFNSEYQAAYKELFDFNVQEEVKRLMYTYPEARDSILQLDYPLLSTDKKLISNYLHALENRQYNLSRRVERFYTEPLDAAVRLIQALKKEYHFK